jgi:hypothetical protein
MSELCVKITEYCLIMSEISLDTVWNVLMCLKCLNMSEFVSTQSEQSLKMSRQSELLKELMS